MVKTKKPEGDYSDSELDTIKENWLRDKAQIQADHPGTYHYDLDKFYERVLHNENLRALFRHAAFLYRGWYENEIVLYPSEVGKVAEVYKEILKNGYYARSKEKEKKVRAHFGKAVSRQYYRRLKRR